MCIRDRVKCLYCFTVKFLHGSRVQQQQSLLQTRLLLLLLHTWFSIKRFSLWMIKFERRSELECFICVIKSVSGGAINRRLIMGHHTESWDWMCEFWMETFLQLDHAVIPHQYFQLQTNLPMITFYHSKIAQLWNILLASVVLSIPTEKFCKNLFTQLKTCSIWNIQKCYFTRI